MAKKKQKTSSKKEKVEGAKADVSDSFTRAAGHYSKLRDLWLDFGQKLQSDVESNFAEQREMYENLSDRWTETYKNLNTRVPRRAEDLKVREFSDIWSNYSNKMMQRLSSAMASTARGYEDFQKRWKEQSSNLGEQILSLSAGDPADWEKVFPYNGWSDFVSGMEGQMADTAEHSLEELNELTRTWKDLSSKMDEVVNSFDTDGEVYKDLADLWKESSKVLGDSLNRLVSHNGNGFGELRESWLNGLSDLEKELLRASEKMGSDYESMLRWYFDSGESWQRMFNRSAREENGELRKKLEELSERVKRLEQGQ